MMFNKENQPVAEPKHLYRIKFYANTPSGDVNKRFCFKLKSALTLREALWRFLGKGWVIRSAWFEKVDYTTGETVNQRIDIDRELKAFAWCIANIKKMETEGISQDKIIDYYNNQVLRS